MILNDQFDLQQFFMGAIDEEELSLRTLLPYKIIKNTMKCFTDNIDDNLSSNIDNNIKKITYNAIALLLIDEIFFSLPKNLFINEEDRKSFKQMMNQIIDSCSHKYHLIEGI